MKSLDFLLPVAKADSSEVANMWSRGFFAFAVIFLTFVYSPETLKADQVLDVSGQLVATGNSVCNPSPCTETIDFNFQVAPYFLSYPQSGLVPGVSGSASGNGPLGSIAFYADPLFTLALAPDIVVGKLYPGTQSGDTLDLGWLVSDINGVVSFGISGGFYSCTSAACKEDFSPDGRGCYESEFCDADEFGEVNVTETLVPEPSAMSLVANGVFLLFLFAGYFRRVAARPGVYSLPPSTSSK